MKLKSKFLLVALSALMLQGCAGNGQNGGLNKQGGGTLIGAAAGGLLGSRFGRGGGSILTTGLGAAAGALIGNQIGQSLDENDRRISELAAQRTLETAPSGTAVAWSNPDSGNSGKIIAQAAHRNNAGQYCREYTQDVVVAGKHQQAYGKACRQPDGTWKIQ